MALYKDTFDTKRCIGVPQTEYGICSAKDKRNIIFTEGLGPCMAIIIYDKSSKTALLAHADNAQADPKNFNTLFEHFASSKTDDLKIIVIGGYSRDIVFGEKNVLPKIVKDFVALSGIKDIDTTHMFERDFNPKSPSERVDLAEASFQFVGFDADSGDLLLHDNTKQRPLPKLYYQTSLTKREDANDKRIEDCDTSFRLAFTVKKNWQDTIKTGSDCAPQSLTSR
jgi:hypothetical protein